MKKEIFIEYAYANGTASEDIDREKEIVGIRCWLDDDKHYFDLALYDVPETMDWHDAKCWCEKNYCRLPMKHEWEFVIANIKRINKMLEKVGGDLLDKSYWSSSEASYYGAWGSTLNLSYGLYDYNKYYTSYVRPVLYDDNSFSFAEIELNIFLLRIQTSKCLLRVIIKNCIGLERKTSRCLTFWKWSQEGLRLIVIPKTLFG